MAKEKKDESFMVKLATLIVDKRKGFYLVFIVLCVFSVLCMNKVKVNNDLTTYLPDTTETRRGLTRMDEQFITYGSARILVCNITYDEAEKLSEKIKELPGVSMLDFDDTKDHYHDMEALYSVTFDEDADSENTKENLENLLSGLSGYDVYYSSDIGQEERDASDLNNDMILILCLAAVVIVAVLLFTSTTYAEIPVYLMTFIVAAILNKGTNFWFGTISFVTNSIAVVLQLGLAVDYAIILAHRFMEEHESKDAREAVIVALSKAIPEISSSSLTTVSGMVAMMFMQFRIGYDMGIILAKSIIFSMVAVFFLMPGLLLTFSKAIDNTHHKSFVPKITAGGGVFVVLKKKKRDFVEAAIVNGGTSSHILWKHILPNILPLMVITAASDIGAMMMELAGLSFLGFGSQPPAPEWGLMLNEGRQQLQTAPWLMIFPGLAIFVTVVIFNLWGDALRDVLDPRQEE